MKKLLLLIGLLLGTPGLGHAQTVSPGDGVARPTGPRSQANPNFLYAYEYAFVNMIKTASSGAWSYADNSGVPGPNELDVNGWPLHNAKAFAHRGTTAYLIGPSQQQRPGHYVMSWIGAGDVAALKKGPNASSISGVVCTGSLSGGADTAACSNAECSAMTASITDGGDRAGTILTVKTPTAGPGCRLVVGQPVYGTGVSINKFGTPTIIVGMAGSANCTSCTGHGGSGTYLVNFVQHVPTGPIWPGVRFEFSVNGEVVPAVIHGVVQKAPAVQYGVSIRESGTAASPSRTVQSLAFYHVDDETGNDESTYASGGLFSPLFMRIMRAGNFGVIRDLNWSNANNSNCTTWDTRKPAAYWSYQAQEFRESIFADPNPPVNASWHSSTRVKARFIGAIDKSILTVSDLTGTISIGDKLAENNGIGLNTYITEQLDNTHFTVTNGKTLGPAPMTITSNDYALSFGSGGTVDKKTIIVQWPKTATTYNVTLSLNGGPPVDIRAPTGGYSLVSVPVTAGQYSTLVYDAMLNAWLNWGGCTAGRECLGGQSQLLWHGNGGLNCGAPPEVFIQLNHELGTNPWIVEYPLAADPITDFSMRYAKYIKDNFPKMVPEFETPNETWNPGLGLLPNAYGNSKTKAYAAADPNHWTALDIDNWTGKTGSLLGQAVSTVYGGDTSRYKVIVGVGTNQSNPTAQKNRLLSEAYVTQDPSKIPVQPSYQQAPAWKFATNVAAVNYWQLAANEGNGSGTQQEVADAYTFFTSAAEQQAAVMHKFMGTANNAAAQYTQYSLSWIVRLWTDWQKWSTTCAGETSAPCPNKGVLGYEGSFSQRPLPADLTVHISGSNQSNACALTTTAAFSQGSITGDKINVSGLADGHKIYSGAIVSGAGVAPNTIIVGKGGNPRRSENGVYYVSPSQTVKGPVAMTASVNGAVPGMLVTVSAASNSAYNGIYAVQPGVSPEAIPINLDCSRLGPLASATLTYSGSANYVTYLRRMAYYSPDLVTLTQQLYATLESLGGSQPSQFTIGQPFGGAAGWGAFFSDIYGYNPAAASTSSSVAGERLNVGGTVTGRFDVGQTIFGAGIPPNTKITSVVTGRGGPGTYRLSRSAPSPLNNIGIQGNVTGPSAQWIAIQSWNKHRQD